jgi:hypothetical protein
LNLTDGKEILLIKVEISDIVARESLIKHLIYRIKDIEMYNSVVQFSGGTPQTHFMSLCRLQRSLLIHEEKLFGRHFNSDLTIIITRINYNKRIWDKL